MSEEAKKEDAKCMGSVQPQSLYDWIKSMIGLGKQITIVPVEAVDQPLPVPAGQTGDCPQCGDATLSIPCECQGCSIERAMLSGGAPIRLWFRRPLPGLEEIERGTRELTAWVRQQRTNRITRTEMLAIIAAHKRLALAIEDAYEIYTRPQGTTTERG